MKRHYYIFTNGRLVRHQNTIYLHTYAGDAPEPDAQALQDAAAQAGCVLEDHEPEADGSRQEAGGRASSAAISDSLPSAPCLLPPASGLLPSASCQLPPDAPRAVLDKKPIPIEDVEA